MRLCPIYYRPELCQEIILNELKPEIFSREELNKQDVTLDLSVTKDRLSAPPELLVLPVPP